MKKHLRIVLYLILFFGIFAAILIFEGKFIGADASTNMNMNKKISQVSVIDALLDFEKKSIEEGNEEQNEGTIYLTGDFEKYSSSAIHKMVKTTLKQINYKKFLQEKEKGSSVIVVIDKQKPLKKKNLLTSPESIEKERSNSITNAQNFSLELIKKIGICNKTTAKMPLMIRHYEYNKKGIRTAVICLAKENPQDNCAEEMGNIIKCSPEMIGKDHITISEFLSQGVLKIGPKVFLETFEKKNKWNDFSNKF